MIALRRVALDIGSARVGVALSDSSGTVATPHAVWDARELAADPRRLRDLIDDYEIGEVVIGMPTGLDGTEGPQARQVRAEADRLQGAIDVPVVFHDERLSTVQAERAMGDAGMDSRARRGRVDMVAAAIILQSYLDTRDEPEEER